MKKGFVLVSILAFSSLISCSNNKDINIKDITQIDNSTNVLISFNTSKDIKTPFVEVTDFNGYDYLLEPIIKEEGKIEVKLPYHSLWDIKIIDKDNDNLSSSKISKKILADEYRIVYLNATLPPLLFATELLLNDNNIPTYICIERAKTYNLNKLPNNVYLIPNVDHSTNMDPTTFINAGVETSNYINSLHMLDNKAKFNFDFVDNYSGALFACIYHNNLKKNNIGNLTIWSDGSYTADYINKKFNTEAKIKEGIEKYKWQIKGAPYNSRYNLIYQSNFLDFALPAAIYENATYYVNDLKTIDMPQNYKDKVMRNLDVGEQFNKLEAKNKLKDFEYLLNTRWGESEEESMYSYFKGSDKNVIIAGTSPEGETSFGNELSFIDNIKYVNKKYKDLGYRIFYKGHPRYPFEEGKGFDNWEERKDLLNEYNIKELVNTIPMETLLLLYEGVYVGGYNSTLYTSSKENQTLFLFGSRSSFENVENLKASFAEGLFDNTEFIDINTNLGE